MEKLAKWFPTMVPVLLDVLEEVSGVVTPWIASNPKLALTLASVALILNHLVPSPSKTITAALGTAVGPASPPPTVQ